ncbi:MAG: hypothetical protein E7306_02495 [Butyrivibrio sp.]|nr:hypothetical protein [Butyrivibrio sp.]
MRKREGYLVLVMCLMLLVTGCGNNSADITRNNATSGSVDEVLFQKISEEESIQSVETETREDQTEKSQDSLIVSSDNTYEEAQADEIDISTDDGECEKNAAPGVDVDLTVLSSTMVYSEVYNMMVSPDNYKGKTVKMKGQFVPYYDEATGKYYFACFISDATACCSQGIEFILSDDYTYPADYPQEGDTICVIGTFDTYMEGESMYCTLRNAVLA